MKQSRQRGLHSKSIPPSEMTKRVPFPVAKQNGNEDSQLRLATPITANLTGGTHDYFLTTAVLKLL